MISDDTVEFDADTGVYRTRFEQENGDLCYALVEAIAAVEQTDPVDVIPLGDSVDLDALERLLQSASDTCSLEMTLPEHGCHVIITSEGIIELKPTDSDRHFTET